MRLEYYGEILSLLLFDTQYDINAHIYVYAGHVGANYITEYCLSYDECYCETCGDSDTLIDSGIKEALIMKYANIINKEEALQKWFLQRYKILPDDYGYVETVKSIIGDNIGLEDNFWVICPDNQDCYTPNIGTIDEFQGVLESDLPQECKFCAFQEFLNRIDNE